MKTALDQDQVIFDLLDASSLKTAISGSIYRSSRPENSQLEDVVISSTALADGEIQEGTSNVNIYVPDLEVTVGAETHHLPNLGRLITLANEAKPLLEEVYGADYNFWIDSTQTIADPEKKLHYFNFKLEFRFINTAT